MSGRAPSPGVSRRAFIVGATSTALLLTAAGPGCRSVPPVIVELGPLLPTSAALVRGLDPDVADELADTVKDLVEEQTHEEATPADVIAILRSAIADDFRAGRCRSVKGWRLSHTELGLAALLAEAE